MGDTILSTAISLAAVMSLALMLGSSGGSVAADLVLVDEGEARAAVVVRANAPDPGPERVAAQTDFFSHYYGPAAQVMSAARASLMHAMEGGLTEEHVEQVRALDSAFAEALRLAGDDDTRWTPLSRQAKGCC